VSTPLVVAAVLAALAVGVGLLPGGRARARERTGMRRGPSGGASGRSPGLDTLGPQDRPSARAAEPVAGVRRPPGRGSSPGRGASARVTWAVSALAGGVVWLLLGGVVGGALGLVVAVVLPVLISRLEPARVRRERLDLIRSAPLVADLLAASLMAGVPLGHAIPVVARAVGGPAAQALMGVHLRTELGEPMARAWAALAATPGLGGVARAVARSSRTGAPLAAMLAQSAQDLRRASSAASLAEVRATGVRAVLPLGLCLLPAFALLGIAPIVGGLLPAL
jgi:Flp pilus assembly protein TadB